MKYATLCSGGLDSVVLAYSLKDADAEQVLVSIDYCQRHTKELLFARLCAHQLGVKHHIVELKGAFAGSALTDPDIDVPTEGDLSSTIVPNRNATFACIAASVGISQGCDAIALAVHGGDHEVYPDCRPVFISQLSVLLNVATGGVIQQVAAPFVFEPKWKIVTAGYAVGVPFEKTWSCYQGGKIHCGICSACRARKDAFVRAAVKDPTEYKE